MIDNVEPKIGLASIKPLVVQGFKLGEGTGGWTNYNPSWPDEFNSLKTLNTGRGYWIKVSSACTLTYGGYIYNLDAGYNLIGWLGCKKPPMDYLAMTDAEFKIALINGRVRVDWWYGADEYRVALVSRLTPLSAMWPNWVGFSLPNGKPDQSTKKVGWCHDNMLLNAILFSNGYASPTSQWRTDLWYGYGGELDTNAIPAQYLMMGDFFYGVTWIKQETYPGANDGQGHSSYAFLINKDDTKFSSYVFIGKPSFESDTIRVGKIGGGSRWGNVSQDRIAEWNF